MKPKQEGIVEILCSKLKVSVRVLFHRITVIMTLFDCQTQLSLVYSKCRVFRPFLVISLSFNAHGFFASKIR